MDRQRFGWLLPTALSGYVALAVVRTKDSAWSLLLFGLVLGLALGLRRLSTKADLPVFDRSRAPLGAALTGTVATILAAFGPDGDPLFQITTALSQATTTTATLVAIAWLEEPRGIKTGHPAARSLDAAYVALVLWSLTLSFIAMGTFAPEVVSSDPPARDTALLFSSLGSQLLICVSLLRLRITRGLELGTGDRATMALVLGIAGTLVGAGSGFVRSATSDLVGGLTLALTGLGVTLAMSDRRATLVVRAVRGTLALGILSVPVALLGAFAAKNSRVDPSLVVFTVALLSTLAGVISRVVSRPLAPEGSRWLDAIDAALDGALHPEPERALSAMLRALAGAEPGAKTRPELFRYHPPGLVSVDVAGYLVQREAEFPLGVFELSAAEIGQTLRREALREAEVRRPDVRPASTWLSAHDALSTTAVLDDEGPIGLLSLPAGRRSSLLSIEEVERLEILAKRLSGLLSITGALRRSEAREGTLRLEHGRAIERMAEMERRLGARSVSGERTAELLAAHTRATGHGRRAREMRDALAGAKEARVVHFRVPPGGDALPWAAELFLESESRTEESARPEDSDASFSIVDASVEIVRRPTYWSEALEPSTFFGERGTLVLLAPEALDEEAEVALRQALERHPGIRLFLVGASGRLESELGGPVLHVPSLAERGEDLSAIVLYELTRIGLSSRGHPMGISRSALAELIELPFPGNEAELRGLLTRAVARASTDVVTSADLHTASHSPPASGDTTTGRTEPELESEPPRRRARRGPRSRPPRA